VRTTSPELLALKAGWSDGQPAEAFADIGATVFTAYFLNFAKN
jgi:hypothetical protein